MENEHDVVEAFRTAIEVSALHFFSDETMPARFQKVNAMVYRCLREIQNKYGGIGLREYLRLDMLPIYRIESARTLQFLMKYEMDLPTAYDLHV